MPSKLNRREAVVDGRHCCAIDHGGTEVLVRDDLLTALTVIDAFADDGLSVEGKLDVVCDALFPESERRKAVEGDFWELLIEACWECCRLDIAHRHPDECGGRRLFDWEQDAGAIRASLLQSYGLTVADCAERFSYRDVCSLIGFVGRETPMGQALYYRTADEPRGTQHNQEQVRRFRELKAAWALKSASTDTYGDMNSQTNDALDGFGRQHG